MRQSLKERLARLGPVQAIDRVTGSPADVVLRPAGSLAQMRTIDAIHGLIRRGVAPKTAMSLIEAVVESGEAFVEVPQVEDRRIFAADMRSAGVEVRGIVKLKQANVRAIRHRLRLSATAFARRYGLNPRTVEGWEQGRTIDEAANNYLHAIEANPDLVGRVLEEKIA